MQRQRLLVIALALAGASLTSLSVPSAMSAVDDQVPVTQDDTITLWAGTVQAPMKLLANDSDPDGERLQICRFGEWQPGSPLDVEPVDDRRGGRVEVTLDPTATGELTYEYRVCDHSYLVPATLTVDAQPVGVTTVEKVPDDPRMLKVTNHDQHAITFFWFPHHTDDFFGYTEIGPGDSQTVRAHASRVDWGAEFVDGDYEVLTGYGTIGGLTTSRVPAPDRTSARVPSALMDALSREAHDGSARGTTYDVVDPTTVAPPTTQGDEVTWWSGSFGRVRVLANDSDPQGQHLDVCRVDRSGRAVSGWTQWDNTGFSVDTSSDASGTYAITYYACNDARLAPGTVTVHLRRAEPVQVSDHAGTLRIANPNGARVRVRLTRLRDYPPLRQLTIEVPAHGVRHVSVAWHRVSWSASIGHRGGRAGDGMLHR